MRIKNLITSTDEFIRKIPDFWESKDNPGRRDCMKGLACLTVGLAFLPITIFPAAAGITLFMGYASKGIYKNIRNEIAHYTIS